MTAPTFTGNTEQLHFDGPGIILLAPYSTSLTIPTFAATTSAFTNSWDTAWVPSGYTDDGFDLTINRTVTEIDAAETLYPVGKVETKQDVSVKFSMMQDNKFNIQRALNGGTFEETGSDGTKVSKYIPAQLGSGGRSAIGWISQTGDQAVIVYKCYQSGNVTFARKKAGTKFMLACDFGAELPDSDVADDMYNIWYAGTVYDTSS